MRHITFRAAFLAAALLCAPSAIANIQLPTDDFENWPLLPAEFPSTGGGGFTIAEYRPVVVGAECRTDFIAIGPDGTKYFNTVAFEAVPAKGGTLCLNGRWKALDGSASGTTPLRVFIRNGVVRGSE